jgi:hypothetical protein
MGTVTYCYSTRDRKYTVEANFAMGAAPRRIRRKVGGKVRSLLRDMSAEARGSTPRSCGNWPLVAEFAGVHPSQVARLREHEAKHGVTTEYTKGGDPIWTGPEHRRKYCEVHGLYDRNGGYSDPQRGASSKYLEG